MISGDSSSLNSFSVSQGGDSDRGGKVTLEAGRSISGLTVTTVASGGQSGDVQIHGDGNVLIDSVNIQTAQTVNVCRYPPCTKASGFTPVFLNGRSQAGNVRVDSLGDLTFLKSKIQSDTLGANPSGNISLTSPGVLRFINSQVLSNTSGSGKAGDITINAPAVSVTASSQIRAETTATSSGNGGNIRINAPTAVDLTRIADGIPVVSVESNGAGRAGTITINTPQLTLSDAAKITATATATSTNQEGGGSVTLNASNINLAGGTVGVFAQTQGQTPAGTLTLTPYPGQSSLTVLFTRGSVMSASTSSSGRGGNFILTAPRSIDLSGPGTLSVETTGSGDAGNMFISTRNLTLSNGVKLLATSSSTGKGGDIRIHATGLMKLQDASEVAVSSTGEGAGGDINITAGRLILDNRAFLNATTDSGKGGNITIDPDLILLRRNSQISTSAGKNRGGGDGGNITITTGFLVAVPFENSDITANAYSGSGGRITINANAIFGFLKAPAGTLNTPFSDIAASSTLGINGTIILNTLNIDPSKGLGELNLGPIDSSRLIVQSCATGKHIVRNENQFIITGRNGMPASPEDLFNAIPILTELGTPDSTDTLASPPNPPAANSPPGTIVEAQGWIVAPNGKVRLIAHSSGLTPLPALFPPALLTCPNNSTSPQHKDLQIK